MLSDGRSYYDVLEVSQKASDKVISNAYKTLIRQNHPDVTGPDGEAETANINLAFQILSDHSKRSEYDLELGDSIHRVSPQQSSAPSASGQSREPSNGRFKVNYTPQTGSTPRSNPKPDASALGSEIEAVKRAEIAPVGLGILTLAHAIAVAVGMIAFILAGYLIITTQPVHPFVILAVALCALVTIYIRKREAQALFAALAILTAAWLALSVHFKLNASAPIVMMVGFLFLLIAMLIMIRRNQNKVIYRRAKEWESLILTGSAMRMKGVYQIMRSSPSSDGSNTNVLLRHYGASQAETTVMLWGVHRAGEWCAVSDSQEVLESAHRVSPKCHKVLREQIPHDHIARLGIRLTGKLL